MDKPEDEYLGNDIYDPAQFAAAVEKVTAFLAAHPAGSDYTYLINVIVADVEYEAANPEANHSPNDSDELLVDGSIPLELAARLYLLREGGKDGRDWLLHDAPGQLDWTASHRQQKFNLAKLPLDEAAIAKMQSFLVGTWYVIEVNGRTMTLHSATAGPAYVQMFIDLERIGLEHWDRPDQWRIAEKLANEEDDE